MAVSRGGFVQGSRRRATNRKRQRSDQCYVADAASTATGGLWLAWLTSTLSYPAVVSQSRYESSLWTAPALVRESRPTAYSRTDRATSSSLGTIASTMATRPPDRSAGRSRRNSRRL